MTEKLYRHIKNLCVSIEEENPLTYIIRLSGEFKGKPIHLEVDIELKEGQLLWDTLEAAVAEYLDVKYDYDLNEDIEQELEDEMNAFLDKTYGALDGKSNKQS